MEEKDWIKVYLFYHPDTNDLKGFTTDKKIAKQFHLERPHYIKKKRTMLTIEYQPFNLYYNGKMLFENVLNDGKGKTFLVITTYDENGMLEYMLSFITDAICQLQTALEAFPLKKKVYKLLMDCINVDLEKETQVLLNFDVLKLYLRFIADYR